MRDSSLRYEYYRMDNVQKMNFVSKGETPAKSLEKTDKKVYNYRINNTHTFDPSYRGRFMAFILETFIVRDG